MTNIFKIINDCREKVPTDLQGTVRALGIELEYNKIDDNLSGMIEKKKDGAYLITVDKNDSPERKRFTLANLIGQYIFHRNALDEAGIAVNLRYRIIRYSTPRI